MYLYLVVGHNLNICEFLITFKIKHIIPLCWNYLVHFSNIRLQASANGPSASGGQDLRAQLMLTSYSTMNSCEIIGHAVLWALPCFAWRLSVALLYWGCHCTPWASKHFWRTPLKIPGSILALQLITSRHEDQCCSLSQLSSCFLTSMCSWSHMFPIFTSVFSESWPSHPTVNKSPSTHCVLTTHPPNFYKGAWDLLCLHTVSTLGIIEIWAHCEMGRNWFNPPGASLSS